MDGRIIFFFVFSAVEASKVLSLAKALDTDVSDFACQTARALTGQAKSQDNFVYQAKPQGSNLQVSTQILLVAMCICLFVLHFSFSQRLYIYTTT